MKTSGEEEIKPIGGYAERERQEPGFTPGPWVSAAEIQQFDLGESFDILGGQDRQVHIATVLNFDDFPCLEEEQAEEMDIEAQANGRLIAAAPTLYEAIQQFVNACEGHMPSWLGNAEARKGYDALHAALALVDGPEGED